MMPLQYVGVMLGSAIFISFASLVWPKVTDRPRPKPLTQVREAVIQTPLGQSMAQVLGVTDETAIARVDPGTFVMQQANSVAESVKSSAQRAVTSRVLQQLAGQFDQLPDDQKEQFRQLICQPVSTPAAETIQE